jgi:chromosome segregation ATPase
VRNREEFEKWAKNEGLQICKGQPWEYLNGFTSRAAQGWNARQPEIDALKRENIGLLNENEKLKSGWFSFDQENSALNEKLESLEAQMQTVGIIESELRNELARIKAENERLRNALQSPESIIALIGSNFSSKSKSLDGDLASVKYVLTAHDLVSAFSSLFDDKQEVK